MISRIDVQKQIEINAIIAGEYVRDNNCTIREASSKLGFSKTCVANYICKLKNIDKTLYDQSYSVLLRNKSLRHIRGGIATKNKFLGGIIMREENELLNSEQLRNELVKKNENVLEKIKAVPFFPTKMFVGIAQAAHYYNVPDESIKGAIRRHKKELSQDGLVILAGEDLKKYKDLNAFDAISKESYIGAKSRMYTVIPKAALLRIGMVLTKSDVASALRTYLLNIENGASTEQKVEASNSAVDTLAYRKQIQIEVQDLQLSVKKEETSAKMEVIQTNKLMKKLSLFGIPKNEAALIVQHAVLYSNDPEESIYKKIEELKALEAKQARGRIRIKIETIAVDYYFENRQTVYHMLSEKMKYIIGVDMQATRSRLKKKHGDTSKLVPSYLDIIADNRACDKAEEVLSIMLNEAIAAEEINKNVQNINDNLTKKERIAQDKIVNDMFNQTKQNS